MDNIVISKCWQDDNLIELYVFAKSKYVSINQYCYISIDDTITNSNLIEKYVRDYNNEMYIEFGSIKGNYTPAFSLKFFPLKSNGHLIIETDLEIDDNDTRCHRCRFYIDAELGAVERFGKKLSKVKDLPMNETISIYDEL